MMINSEAKTNCFVCNLPIQSHQVGLVWQGGNGVDDLLREQVDQDIIRGRLGRGHRRDSSAQITTIDADDMGMGYGGNTTPPLTSKRRRSSLAQLGELLQSWGSKDKEKYDRGAGVAVPPSRRGTLAEISKNLPWMRRESQAEVISKIRKRRETSADITIFRKSSVVDIKSDISRILSMRQDSVNRGIFSPQDSREDLDKRNIYERRYKHQDSAKHYLYRSKMESTNVPFPQSPTSPDIPTTTPSIYQSTSPTGHGQPLETRSLNSSNSKDSSGPPLSEHPDSKGTSEDSGSRGACDNVSPQLSPTSRQKIRRQSTAYDECVNPKQCISGSNRRGSRPFLSPGAEDNYRSSRRDSLSPDSAAEDNISRKGRRDSNVGGNSSDKDSRESSPRARWRRAGRRKSSAAALEEKLTTRKSKQHHSHSPDSGSSREASPKFGEGHPTIGIRRQSTTDEILIARGFRRESTTEDLMRCRNFRRQSSTADLDMNRRGRRDSATQIIDGQVNTMTIETTQVGLFETTTQPDSGGMYENSNYHEECLKCNSCGLNLTGPNQKRARRFKNQILCDLHFADMALMESSDFMQQLRNFKAQSLGCAVARRKSSTTLIFPLPPQACSDEFCEYYPHNLIPNPGYWIECSRVITSSSNNHIDKDLEEAEEEEGSLDSLENEERAQDAENGSSHENRNRRTSLPIIQEPNRKKSNIEEHWSRYGSFELTSVVQETHEKYFYGTEHWNYFTNDEDLGPVILSLKQENINGRDQFRILVRAVGYTIHGLIPASCVFADRYNREEVVASLGREINLNPPLTLGQLPDTSEELMKLDQVFIKSELKVGVIYVKEGQYTEEEILDNNEHSANFDEFLTILGDKCRLKGFDKYKGGLDTVHDLTGLHSVYTHWRGIEVMFHVSSLLPYEKSDPQKLQRKRHVGNDIVCVVFLEADNTRFSPSCIKSHFLHTFIVVRCSPKIKFKPTRYEISVVTRDEVGAYKPYLWEQSTFTKGPMFRDWLLAKIVNGERASYSAPKFARMQERTRSQMLEDLVANLQNHAETGQIPKPYRRGSWRPIGHMRPSSPLLDSVRDQFEGQDQMAKDFGKAFVKTHPEINNLFDVTFLVGDKGKSKKKLFGVRAILGVRSRVFQEMLYGISTVFGSPQVPVAELLARPVPTLHSPSVHGKKSSNFLQVPEIEAPRPKSVPNSPSMPRTIFSNIRVQMSSAWTGNGGTKPKVDRLGVEDKKKWPSEHDFANESKSKSGKNNADSSNLAVPKLSVCADAQKVDRHKLLQTEFPIIEFDAETFQVLLDYLHSGCCPLSCISIPGLICAAEHYDLPDLIQACFHHAKQFIRTEIACQMLIALESYYWRYCSALELVNMILAFIETRALAIFHNVHFLDLSESMVQMTMARNLEIPEIHKFEAMLKWAKHYIKKQGYKDKIDAKIDFRACMERLSRDLKLYRISPQDLIKTVLPSKAIKNERILETLMFQANSGMYRIHDSYLEACQEKIQKQDSKFSEWESFDYTL